MAEGITIRGIPEVMRNLEQFPKLVVMGCFAKAGSRAIAVFEAELRARCPEAVDGATSDEEYGTLVENLTSTVEVDSEGRGVHARVGFGRKDFVAFLVEFGHIKTTHAGKQLGFVPPNPFMRQSFSAAADTALEVFIEEVESFVGSMNMSSAA